MYENFRLVKLLSLSPTLLFDRTAKVRSFDIHKCRPVPSLPYPFVKDHAKSHNQTLSCHHPPHLLPLLFFRKCKVTNFLPLSRPPLSSSPTRHGKITDFWAFASVPSNNPYPLKDPYASQGRERKGTEFSALSSPPSDSLSSKINRRPSERAKLRSFSLCQAPLFGLAFR